MGYTVRLWKDQAQFWGLSYSKWPKWQHPDTFWSVCTNNSASWAKNCCLVK